MRWLADAIAVSSESRSTLVGPIAPAEFSSHTYTLHATGASGGAFEEEASNERGSSSVTKRTQLLCCPTRSRARLNGDGKTRPAQRRPTASTGAHPKGIDWRATEGVWVADLPSQPRSRSRQEAACEMLATPVRPVASSNERSRATHGRHDGHAPREEWTVDDQPRGEKRTRAKPAASQASTGDWSRERETWNREESG